MPVLKPPTGNPDGPQQYKQPSRKGKKAWRKNVDVSEIEQGLDQMNDEIILTGGVIAEKQSEDLFMVDVAGDASIAQKFPKHIKKGLKAEEIISKRSAVPAVPMRKRAGESKTTDGVLPVKRLRATYVNQKELRRLKKVADGQHEESIAIIEADHDVWATPLENPDAEKYTFLKLAEKAKAPKTMKEQPLSLAANGKSIPAVITPKGGASYNPVFTDYQERLAEESAKAVEAERKRLEALEAERIKLEASARSAAEADAAEARANMSEWEEDSEWDGLGSGGEELSTKAKRPQRKTQVQRNKIKRRKEEERKAKAAALLKKKNAQAERIKQISEEVAEKHRARELEKIELDDEDEEGDEDKLRRRQLGKFKLPDKDLELVLPDELQDSLRLLKPEGSLLKDRYRSMLVRGKVEARRNLPFHRQAKKQITEKWTFKDFVI